MNICCFHNCITAVHIWAYSPSEALCPVTKTDGTVKLESQSNGSSKRMTCISFYELFLCENVHEQSLICALIENNTI